MICMCVTRLWFSVDVVDDYVSPSSLDTFIIRWVARRIAYITILDFQTLQFLLDFFYLTCYIVLT